VHVQGQNGFGHCLGACNTDFKTKKYHGVSIRMFGEKKIISPKSMPKLEALMVQFFLCLPYHNFINFRLFAAAPKPDQQWRNIK
jgi:hypothetical protein